jgi:hypothetical protein
MNSDEINNDETKNNKDNISQNNISSDQDNNTLKEDEIDVQNDYYEDNKSLNYIEIRANSNTEENTNNDKINKENNLSLIQTNEKMNFAFLEEELNDMIKNSMCSQNFSLFENEIKSDFLLNCDEIDNLVLQDKI